MENYLPSIHVSSTLCLLHCILIVSGKLACSVYWRGIGKRQGIILVLLLLLQPQELSQYLRGGICDTISSIKQLWHIICHKYDSATFSNGCVTYFKFACQESNILYNKVSLSIFECQFINACNRHLCYVIVYCFVGSYCFIGWKRSCQICWNSRKAGM